MTERMFVASCLCALLALGFASVPDAAAASGLVAGSVFAKDAAAARIEESRQLLVVVGESWDGSRGVMHFYERDEAAGPWRLAAGSIPVMLGVKGMAWGRGLHEDAPVASAAPVKREGDGRAPAGVFELGPAFGYAPVEDLPPMNIEYLRLDETTVCVDDPASSRYNAILDKTGTASDWASAETMLRDDGQYKCGLVVRHNDSPALPGGGSCIFIHVWRAEGKPTSGCTAMREGDVRALLAWLDPAKRPLLVQFPAELQAEVQQNWGLPTP